MRGTLGLAGKFAVSVRHHAGAVLTPAVSVVHTAGESGYTEVVGGGVRLGGVGVPSTAAARHAPRPLRPYAPGRPPSWRSRGGTAAASMAAPCRHQHRRGGPLWGLDSAGDCRVVPLPPQWDFNSVPFRGKIVDSQVVPAARQRTPESQWGKRAARVTPPVRQRRSDCQRIENGRCRFPVLLLPAASAAAAPPHRALSAPLSP